MSALSGVPDAPSEDSGCREHQAGLGKALGSKTRTSRGWGGAGAWKRAWRGEEGGERRPRLREREWMFLRRERTESLFSCVLDTAPW